MVQAQRPKAPTLDTLDTVPRLSGTLSSEGVAELDAASNAPTASDDGLFDGGPSHDAYKSNTAFESNDESEEDYEVQARRGSALVEDSHGGDLQLDASDIDPTNVARRRKVPIRLEKTDKRGRYLLHAGDDELRDIIKKSVQRQNGPLASNQRKGLRDLVFTRRFTTFDPRNPSTSESAFKGFFVLFWIVMISMLLRVAALNWRKYGGVLGQNEVLNMMLSKDVLVLGLTDGVMTALTYFGVVLQKILAQGYLRWETSGWIIQNIWQTFYLFGIIGWTFYRDWPWTHTIFIVLHAFVFLMKQHSYAFYNGYLSQVFKRKQVIERKLHQLQVMSPPTSPVRSPTLDSAGQSKRISTSPTSPPRFASHPRQTSISSQRPIHKNLSYETPEIAEAAEAISSGAELDSEQMDIFQQILSHELHLLTEELKGKCTLTKNYYPHNLTTFDWAEWTCFPTLVYELEYPRQERINWRYVAEKSCATFGCIFAMMVISQAYIYPPVVETIRMKEAGMNVSERWIEFPWIVGDMLFPLLLEQLLTWYVIWECVLNVLAELTRFADRGFYGDWWNSVSWDQYSRRWNAPVYSWLLRHVYHSSISAFHVSKTSAMFITFLLSACVHELVMVCLFKKLRGYLLLMQLLQMPLAMLSQTRLLKDRPTLGNIIFWVGLFVGPSFLTCLYLIV